MARLYTNENFPIPVAAELRRMGHDVLTIQDSGMAGQALADTKILAFAHSQGRAVVTINRRHFVRLHMANPDHSGIIVCTFDPDFTMQASRIDRELKQYSTLAGQLIRINRART
jgi:Domain of unknown function (DUF5615)